MVIPEATGRMENYEYYSLLKERISVPNDPRAMQVSLLLPMGVIFLFIQPSVASLWISIPVSVLLAIAVVAILALAKVSVQRRARITPQMLATAGAWAAMADREAKVEEAVSRADEANRILVAQVESMRQAMLDSLSQNYQAYFSEYPQSALTYSTGIVGPEKSGEKARATGGGTLFERMSRIARGEGEDITGDASSVKNESEGKG